MDKKYIINTFEQMAAIPEDAWGRLADELPKMLAAYSMGKAILDGLETHQDMIWIDDGNRDSAFTVSDRDSGKIVVSLKIKAKA